MKNGMRWILPRLLVCALLTGGSGACVAQNTNSGDLRGTATDKTGAVIQGVTVNVTDIDQGVTRTYVTDGAGLYDTGAIPEDHYQVKFTQSRFSDSGTRAGHGDPRNSNRECGDASRAGHAAGDSDDRHSHARHRERSLEPTLVADLRWMSCRR